jgi:hypothetical protein
MPASAPGIHTIPSERSESIAGIKLASNLQTKSARKARRVRA